VPPSRTRQLRVKLGAAIADRLSPERIRRATLLERLTVRRLPWVWVERLNRYLALAGKLATVVWVAFIGSAVLGVHWKAVVEHAVNSGKPVKGAIALAVLVPTLAFLVARSALGFGRWRLQRELWRRDVERLGAATPRDPAQAPLSRAPGAPPSAPAGERPPRAARP
jgi:hypothetical protein